MKEAAGVCGGRGQVMEKVRECGLKLSREGGFESSEDDRGRRWVSLQDGACASVRCPQAWNTSGFEWAGTRRRRRARARQEVGMENPLRRIGEDVR
jgi:hypothetical protein